MLFLPFIEAVRVLGLPAEVVAIFGKAAWLNQLGSHVAGVLKVTTISINEGSVTERG